MTTYTPYAPSELDPDSPVTSTLASRWANNPIAIAEGADNAPVISTGWHPYNMLNVGDGNTGRIWDFATDGGVGPIDSPALVDGYEYALRFLDLSFSGGSPGLRLQGRLATDNSHITISDSGPISAGVSMRGIVRFAYPRLGARVHSVIWEGALHDSNGTIIDTPVTAGRSTVLSGLNRIRITDTLGANSFDGGASSFDGGSIFMWRRRTFV